MHALTSETDTRITNGEKQGSTEVRTTEFRTVLKKAAILFVLVTCPFLRIWLELTRSSGAYLFLRESPLVSALLPLLLAEAAVAGLAVGVALFLSRTPRGKTAIDWLFLGSCSVLWMVSARPFGRLCVLAGMAILFAGFWNRRKTVAVAQTACLAIALPLLLVCIRGAWNGISIRPSAFADHPTGRPMVASTGDRIVLIIFDEFSRDIAFDHRPTGLDLPNFDRIRTESFYGAHAHSPAQWTLLSVPGLLIGRPIFGAKSSGPDDYRVQLSENGPFAQWAKEPSIFDDAAALGKTAGAVGWDLPYGRLISEKVSFASWRSSSSSVESQAWYGQGSAVTRAKRLVTFEFSELPLVGRPYRVDPTRWNKQGHIDRLEGTWSAARDLIRDPRYGLVVVHLPAPHTPVIYDRSTKRFTPDCDQCTYLDNVALTDRLVGEAMQDLDEPAIRSRTHLIVTADHGVRWWLWKQGTVDLPADPKVARIAEKTDPYDVPFLIRFAGQARQLRYERSFNTVAVRRLINEIYSGAVRTPEAAGRFLDGFQSPPPVSRSVKPPGM